MSGRSPPPGISRIAHPRRRLITGIALGLWLSGTAWLLSHVVFVPQGEFGSAYRRADAWLLMAHGAFGFLAVWSFGLLWGTHVTAGWAQGRRRVSGGALFGAVSLLAVTGYALYYCGEERLRGWISLSHWTLGLVSPAAFLLHRHAARVFRRGKRTI